MLAKDLGSIQKLGYVRIKGSTGPEEGLHIISMTIGAVWVVLSRERIAGVYTVLERKVNERNRLGSLIKEVWHDHLDIELGRYNVCTLDGLGPEAEDVVDT